MTHPMNEFLKGLEKLGVWRLNFRPSSVDKNRMVCYGDWLHKGDKYSIIFNVSGCLEKEYDIETKELRKQLNKNLSWKSVIETFGSEGTIDLFYLEEPFVLGLPIEIPTPHRDYLEKKEFKINRAVALDSKYSDAILCYSQFKNVSVLVVIDDNEIRKSFLMHRNKRISRVK